MAHSWWAWSNCPVVEAWTQKDSWKCPIKYLFSSLRLFQAVFEVSSIIKTISNSNSLLNRLYGPLLTHVWHKKYMPSGTVIIGDYKSPSDGILFLWWVGSIGLIEAIFEARMKDMLQISQNGQNSVKNSCFRQFLLVNWRPDAFQANLLCKRC